MPETSYLSLWQKWARLTEGEELPTCDLPHRKKEAYLDVREGSPAYTNHHTPNLLICVGDIGNDGVCEVSHVQRRD